MPSTFSQPTKYMYMRTIKMRLTIQKKVFGTAKVDARYLIIKIKNGCQ